ncbi:cytochrome b5 reductase 4-like isoform X2 [Leptotrombidium deliense]|uniref:Cytochrome b5 reductase 4-like isoform X2 n=1 Tax=Leptotrombidium deliense TaxID=299467 RepID=A0A443SHU0_9ACAR|nr:cytochrome b5 reductase 4-like isoform X2 [Leptotrombidium deliense]
MSSLKVESGKQRIKVALKPQHSLLDWIKFSRAANDLSGTGGRLLEVSLEELQSHNSKEDCWLLIKGHVYNVTAFMDYHPGGVDELLRGVGMDSTDLFNSVHRWVNIESMLAKCLVGRLKPGTVVEKAPVNSSS